MNWAQDVTARSSICALEVVRHAVNTHELFWNWQNFTLVTSCWLVQPKASKISRHYVIVAAKSKIFDYGKLKESFHTQNENKNKCVTDGPPEIVVTAKPEMLIFLEL